MQGALLTLCFTSLSSVICTEQGPLTPFLWWNVIAVSKRRGPQREVVCAGVSVGGMGCVGGALGIFLGRPPCFEHPSLARKEPVSPQVDTESKWHWNENGELGLCAHVCTLKMRFHPRGNEITKPTGRSPLVPDCCIQMWSFSLWSGKLCRSGPNKPLSRRSSWEAHLDCHSASPLAVPFNHQPPHRLAGSTPSSRPHFLTSALRDDMFSYPIQWLSRLGKSLVPAADNELSTAIELLTRVF